MSNQSSDQNEDETEEQSPEPAEPVTPSSSRFSTLSDNLKKRRMTLPFGLGNKEATPWKEPQPFEVLRAVENKDLMYLMEVRDRAFHLLLRKTGDVTPLLHAMRIGPSHREVAIVLVGSLSRWVNHLDDSEVEKPRTKTLLKALRINLKLAIDYGLQSSQSDLLASFLQTLIMSEGDKWVWSQIMSVGLALRSIPGEGKPVETAELAVRAFATRELGKAAAIATLEDYIANATADLLMMASWNLASQSVGGEPIPTYAFARDERVYSVFLARIKEYQDQIAATCTRRLRWQIKLLQTAIKGRNITFRRKVEMLRAEMDSGAGP
ncbi:hypothetical protein M408DRAFT_329967 [Serendipita vermifera MAFF 305830]|uniref:Uncharacterized protein n=1 Tax=Serendipita vermifera MAFF 305830 TaxID=933852 RepID=A0A0C3ASI6_SERVB|nr:hypothetical protein M408DRAFT_329967 [Serendipita vermifera MAFF 305830]